jgi:hypothetical protein
MESQRVKGKEKQETRNYVIRPVLKEKFNKTVMIFNSRESKK